MGEFDPDDKEFQKWLKLRKDYKGVKREKDHKKIISICQKVIQFDHKAKHIGILVPLFEKDMAKSYKELGQNAEALIHYGNALQGYREDGESDWAKEIASIEKIIAKLTTNNEGF